MRTSDSKNKLYALSLGVFCCVWHRRKLFANSAVLCCRGKQQTTPRYDVKICQREFDYALFEHIILIYSVLSIKPFGVVKI